MKKAHRVRKPKTGLKKFWVRKWMRKKLPSDANVGAAVYPKIDDKVDPKDEKFVDGDFIYLVDAKTVRKLPEEMRVIIAADHAEGRGKEKSVEKIIGRFIDKLISNDQGRRAANYANEYGLREKLQEAIDATLELIENDAEYGKRTTYSAMLHFAEEFREKYGYPDRPKIEQIGGKYFDAELDEGYLDVAERVAKRERLHEQLLEVAEFYNILIGEPNDVELKKIAKATIQEKIENGEIEKADKIAEKYKLEIDLSWMIVDLVIAKFGDEKEYRELEKTISRSGPVSWDHRDEEIRYDHQINRIIDDTLDKLESSDLEPRVKYELMLRFAEKHHICFSYRYDPERTRIKEIEKKYKEID